MSDSLLNHPLAWAHPLVRDWFIAKFGEPTEPQIAGWPSILAGNATLISAPTGSGKTLAAFLTCINQLVCQAAKGELEDKTEVLYVSPLKALSNDVQINLTCPLEEIINLAKSRGIHLPPIRAAVRTGDTLAHERQAMLKKPPHILVTTPESLFILLTAEKSRAMLSDVKTVLVDEIHALANSKRGAHLALSLERLEKLVHSPLVRIGLSATQKPIELMAYFLAGTKRAMPTIINIGHARQLDIAVLVPDSELGAVASNEMWDEIYDKIAKLTETHRSTLIFVNTRRLAERVAHHLTERLGTDKMAAHHGSLSRKLRLATETKLKMGELKALVATASLELGIDIGDIDLVCQIGSPRSIAVALQRIGRAGHWCGAIPKGRIFATTRDELLECAALVKSIKESELDALIIPDKPLDILAQQIVAMSTQTEWDEDELFNSVTQAYPFANLTKDEFDSVLIMLSDGVAGSRGRYGAYLFRDRVHNKIKGRRNSRLTAIMSGGAIPENGLFTVIAEPQGIMVGTLDEDFAVESNRGDIILLGTTSWQIRRIEGKTGKVYVEDAHGAPPSVPFWRGEAPARTKELSTQVASLRETLSDLLPVNLTPLANTSKLPQSKNAIDWLKENGGLEQMGAEQAVEYILQGRAVLGQVPTQKTIIAERFFDEGGGMQLIIHSPFGARINKAWGLALRKRFCCSFNFELQAAATDDGLNIALSEQHSFPLSDVFQFLHTNTLQEVLTQAVLQSPLFPTRWRWVATRSLALVRYRNGKKVPPHILRMLSDDLLAAVFPDAVACQDNLAGRDVELPNHPLTNEAMKDVMTEALDLEGLTHLIQQIQEGKIQCIAIDTPLPSVFSHEILNANPYAYLDDAPLEERRARAVEMRRILPEAVLQEVGKLDEAAIFEVKEQAWPDVRNADELHDVLQTFIALPDTLLLGQPSFFQELVSENRISNAIVKNKIYWFAVEKAKTFSAIYPEVTLNEALPHIEKEIVKREEAIVTMLRGWLQHIGPITVLELSHLLGIELTDIDQALLKLESTGAILRGQFRTTDKDQLEWCDRRLLARIHRLTLGKLRNEIEPVTAAQFMHWLLKWQHLTPSTQLRGEKGLLEIIKQLQGFELPANAWERDIFAARMLDYDKDMLDQLCVSGVVGWGRFSTHPLIKTENEEEIKKKRIIPNSVAPITFFIREEALWIPHHPMLNNEEELEKLSHAARKIYSYLTQRGASFLADITRSVAALKTEVELGLWELVAVGLVTADAFDNLRGLIDPKRRAGKMGRRRRIGFGGGRWSLLRHEEVTDATAQLEATCWMLLKRYGVVFRDLLAREKNIPRWRELLVTFRRLEDRGEIRGGRFVSGFLGEQFALPYAVDSLRAIKKELPKDESVALSALDPLNLLGIILPGGRVSAASRKIISFVDGVPQEESFTEKE